MIKVYNFATMCPPGSFNRLAKIFLGIIIGLVIVIACLIGLSIVLSADSGKDVQTTDSTSTDICLSKGCTMTATVLSESMNLNIDPCQDFYHFACGNYELTASVPSQLDYRARDTDIDESVSTAIRAMLDEKKKEDDLPVYNKVKDFYGECMDKARLHDLGDNPMLALLKRLGGWPVVDGLEWKQDHSFSWRQFMIDLQKEGMDNNFIITIEISEDPTDKSAYAIIMDIPSIAIPDLYDSNDTSQETSIWMKKYVEQLIGAALQLRAQSDRAKIELLDVLQFESDLRELIIDQLKANEKKKKHYKISMKEMDKELPFARWTSSLSLMFSQEFKEEDTVYMYSDTSTLHSIMKFVGESNKRTVANYMMWRGIQPYLQMLGQNMENIMTGRTYKGLDSSMGPIKPRWKFCIRNVDKYFSMALGNMYIKRNFDNSSLEKVKEMVNFITKEIKDIVSKTEWMDQSTRHKALAKAEAMYTMFGFPEESLDDNFVNEYYKESKVTEDDFFGTILDLGKVSLNRSITRLKQDRSKFRFEPLSQNVAISTTRYYPLSNTRVIPAGAIQGYNFMSDRPNYVNYAALGFQVAQITLGAFDNIGARYNEFGQEISWWGQNTSQQFEYKARCMIIRYGDKFVDEDIRIDSEGTLGRNVADNGGFKVAYRAYMKWAAANAKESEILPFISDVKKLFWISFANGLCHRDISSKVSRAAALLMPKTFISAMIRVNGVAINSHQFVKDFNCQQGTKMNPATKCAIW